VTDPRVAAALEAAVRLGEHSVQVAAYLDGELIVDASTGPIDASAVFPIFSVSKAVTALAVHVQAARGRLDYDAPLAHYWPEYAAHGKDAITVRHVLTHRAGVPEMPADVTPERLGDWDWMVGRLAELVPTYPPGTRNTYLSMTFGWLLGEVVSRTDPQRRPFGRFVQEELCEPLGIDALWLGIPEHEQHRVQTLTYADDPPVTAPASLAGRAVPAGVGLVPEVFNRAEVQRGCIPSVGGIANARSVARVFSIYAGAGAVDGTRLLEPHRVQSFLEPRPDAREPDETYGQRLPVGAGGLWTVAPGVSATGTLRSNVLSHPGAGGSIGWAELETGLAVAICHDRMFEPGPEAPFAALGDAVREVAAERSLRTSEEGRSSRRGNSGPSRC
jgi:CubicO group peptidase (beta-lactamase class C family)